LVTILAISVYSIRAGERWRKICGKEKAKKKTRPWTLSVIRKTKRAK